MTNQISDAKLTDGTAISPEPRIQEARWTAKRIWRRSRYAVITIINLAIFAIIWEQFATWYDRPAFLATFSDTMAAFKVGWLGSGADSSNEAFDLLQDYVIAKNFLVTLKVYGLGMTVAILAGIPIGLAMGGSKWADAILSPYVWTLSSLPRIAIFPVLILFLGLGDEIKYALVILTAIFQ